MLTKWFNYFIEKSLPSKKLNFTQTLNKINLSPNFIHQIESVLEPIIVGIYFTSIEPLVKQRCIPIFDSCYFLSAQLLSNHGTESIKSFNFDADNNMVLEFSKEYSAYITHDNYTTQTLCQKGIAIYLMLDFPLGLSILEESNVLGMCQKESKPINDIEIFANSLMFSQHMNDAQHVIKTLLALLSRFDKILRPKFELIRESCDDNSVELTKIRDLLNGCITICSDEIYVKDVRLLTGMTLAAILNLLGSLQYVNDLVLSLFFVWPITRERESLIMSLLRIQTSDMPLMENGWQGECPTIITYFCDNAITSQTKVMAFETMGMWLQETEIILRGSNVNNNEVLEIQAIFDSQNLDKLMSYVWNNCDDPVDAIQYKTIFEKLLDILSIKRKYENTDDCYNQFFSNLLKQLLLMDPYRKVKYVLLLLLLPRVRTNVFLKIQVDFVQRTLEVLHNTTIAPRSSQLLASFFEQSLKELLETSTKQIEPNNEKKKTSEMQKEAVINDWIDLWLTPVCQCLTSPNDTLRNNIGGFILKPLFKVDPLSFWKILDIIKYNKLSNDFVKDEHYRLNALIIIIKTARSLDLVDDESDSCDDKKIKLQSLRNAIYHIDPNLRIDVLGLISESQKSTTEVTSTELSLLKSFFELNLNSTSPEFRQKMYGHLNKLFFRLQGNLYAQWRDYKSLLKYVENNSSTIKNIKVSQALLEAEQLKHKIDVSQNFLNWLIELLVASLYPGASFQRVSCALKIFIILIRTFGLRNESSFPKEYVDKQNESSSFPFQLPLVTTRNVQLILNCLMNSFDEIRTLSYEILEMFPSPLPGIKLFDDVQEILLWAFQLMTSTRAGESDSGATIFSLIFSKYVLKLGYDLDVELDKSPPVSSLSSEFNDKSTAFIGKLMVLLEKQIKIASQNLLLASRKYPMHGTLLALQYIFQKLDYNSTIIKYNLMEWRVVHDKVISLTNQVCQIVLEILSDPSPEGNVPASFQEMDEFIEEFVYSSNDVDVESDEGPKHQEDICAITTNSISITRRSAGLPLCILAIVSSEPSTQKILLPWAMKTLLDIGSQNISSDGDIDQQIVDLPQVHAFNILRTIFMDAKLGADVLPYVSDGFMTLGTKKTKDEHHSINQLTSREFFSRFPKLHPFLVDELKIAVNQLVKPTQIPVICYENPCEMTKYLFLEIINEFVFDSKWTLNEQDKRKRLVLITLMDEKFAKMRQTIFDFSVSNLFDKSDATLKIGNFLTRQQIAKVIIKSLLNQDTIERNEIMINILSDEEYEVRVTALEMLLEYFLEMDAIHIGTRLDLEEFCKKLFRYMEKSKSSSIIEATLILLGALTAEIWNETSLPHEFRSLSLKNWTEYINKNTKPEIDDDIDIRRTAALIVSKAMGLEDPVDCDRARELCYEHMTNQYSRSLHLYVALLQILTRDVKPEQISNANLIFHNIVFIQKDEILKSEMTPSRVLFAIENPNIYKEDLVDIQLAYKYLLIAIKKERDRLEFPEMFRKDIPRIQLHPLLDDLLLGELSQNCFNIITKGEDKDGNEFMTFSKEFERLFLLSTQEINK
ncbi:4907_t:CDS:10 [Racocetra fulgida]|uniref:4907_t:CDS:1 n=1 Tax=Racocetra fulgida TaxID=60492 RepID=A0A9N8YW66_9GLOM|nr:4907_t:CDS:10 [Racocetra fulgida]